MDEGRDARDLASAFDGEAEGYARNFSERPSARAMRAQVHRAYARYLRPGQRVLDINCGPGPDFDFFRRTGLEVTGLDLSPAMLAAARERHPEAHLLCLDFNRLAEVEGPFDAVCSNFGGLNTQDEFTELARQCRRLLQPDGLFFANIMTRLPLPEILEGVLRGRHFLRRLRGGGRQVLTVGGRPVTTHYFHPGSFYRRHFRADFRLLAIVGLGFLLPPPYLDLRPSALIDALAAGERALGRCYPFNRLGDHALLILRSHASPNKSFT